MVKKILFTIAVVAFLAVTVQAADPGSKVIFPGGIKADDMWPFEYVYVEMCTMPILMDVGYFVQVHECHKRKIKLVQVTCESIGKEGKHFPCYEDCDTIKVRANFRAQLGGNVTSSVSWFNKDKTSVYYRDCIGDACVPNIIEGDGDWHETKVCVRAWEVKIWDAGDDQGDNEATVGTLAVTVKPTQG